MRRPLWMCGALALSCPQENARFPCPPYAWPHFDEEEIMKTPLTLFIAAFATLRALINPLEAPGLPELLQGTAEKDHRKVAGRSFF